LIGTVAAMVVTQSLRSEGPVASDVRLKVNPDEYRACFRLQRDDTVDVAMVRFEDGSVVRVLAANQSLEARDEDDDSDKASAHCFDWDGLDAEGQPAGPGRYRLRLHLEEADRVATSGERLRIRPGGPGT
jgi:hypothetical protein